MAVTDPIKSVRPPRFKGRARDLTGETFGRLIIQGFAGRNQRGEYVWSCRCDCGKTTRVITSYLIRGLTKSCGCVWATHGLTGSPEYEAWRQMIQRCTNPRSRGWRNYGGRGILVCDRWRNSFEAFLADVGPRPTPDHSLDRINNSRGYEPGNCRWATRQQQGRNRRTNVLLTHEGHTLSAKEWAELLSVPHNRIYQRLYRRLPMNLILYPGRLNQTVV